MNDILDEQEFYELMQAYRRVPIGGRSAVAKAYEDVKKYIREKVIGEPQSKPNTEMVAQVKVRR